MLKQTLLIFFLISIVKISEAQSIVKSSIQLLDADVIANANLVKEPFFSWVESFNDSIQRLCSELEGDKQVYALVTLHSNRPADISVHSRPKMDEAKRQKIIEVLRDIDAPFTKFTDYSFLVIVEINKGFNELEDIPFKPEFLLPLDREMDAFKSYSLLDKKLILQDFAEREVLPIIEYYASNVDSQFIGVRWVGEMLKFKMHKYVDIDSLFHSSPEYWRAGMEMTAGNQLIPFAKMTMHLARGEFDKAERLSFLIRLFSAEKTLADAFDIRLLSKLKFLNEDLGKEINKGISKHNEQKYKEAIEIYYSLERDLQQSAWLQYEIYFSKSMTMDIEGGRALWKNSKLRIYDLDPLYPMDVNATNGRDAYLLYRRMSIKELFQEEDQLKNDVIEYADIAMDLEAYGFAAQLYWLILSHFDKEDYRGRNLLAHYLYCLDKLGDKTNIHNFEGDFDAEFKTIEVAIIDRIEKSPFYNSFKEKE